MQYFIVFIVPLYHFTSQHKTADLQFEFDDPSTRLLVSDFEFQPSEEKVELQGFEEFQHIVEVASQSLFYTSLYELKRILSKGVHLNGYKTWFSLNEIGEHCHMISIKDCLIPNEDFPSQYQSNSQSRFPAGLYQTNNKGFITHVKTHFLSPLITYTVNLVFDISSYGEQAYVDLKYRLKGETPTSTVYLANKRKDDRLYMAELYQFTSEGSIVDLEIMFDDCETNIGVEGILFQPLEIVVVMVVVEEGFMMILFVMKTRWKTQINFKLLDTKSNIVANWKIFQQGERSIYQIIRANGADTVYMSFGAMLKDFTREDLIELYRLVMQKYGTNRPEDAYDRVLWSDLRTMFDPPLNEDAIWSLPLQQKMISWRYYDKCAVHCLTLEACNIYMLADRKYPLSKDACQVMLKMKLLDGKMNEVCYKLLKMIEKQAGVKK
ncbi:hypothetical protein Tco_0588944 [Tanacetum coccineum]